MSRNELITTIEQLKEWEAILEEAQAEAEALRDSIKVQMLQEDTEELAVGAYIIRWTSVLSNRFDSNAFKKEHGDLYKTFTKQVASKRFTIAWKKALFEKADQSHEKSPPTVKRAWSL